MNTNSNKSPKKTRKEKGSKTPKNGEKTSNEQPAQKGREKTTNAPAAGNRSSEEDDDENSSSSDEELHTKSSSFLKRLAKKADNLAKNHHPTLVLKGRTQAAQQEAYRLWRDKVEVAVPSGLRELLTQNPSQWTDTIKAVIHGRGEKCPKLSRLTDLYEDCDEALFSFMLQCFDETAVAPTAIPRYQS